MSEQLSQDEVEALRRGIADGEVEAQRPPVHGEVRPYDLVGEERFVGRRFQALDLVLDRLARRLRPSLAGMVGAPPEIQPAGLEMLKFGTFRNRLGTPSSLHLFTMAPLRGQALLVVSAPLAFALIDRVFGGPGEAPTTFAAREYSAIEVEIIQTMVRHVLGDLREAWTPLQRVDCAFVRSEVNPASVTITGPGEMVLVLRVHCDLGIGPTPLSVALPFSMLEPLRDKLGEPEATPETAPAEWQEILTRAVGEAEVTLQAELGTRELRTREVLGLQVGDLLMLDTRGDDPTTLSVEGVRVFVGTPGVSRGSNAVRVLGRA